MPETTNGHWLVLDWNLIQSMPATSDVPAHYKCVILAQTFHEIANKESERGTQAINKLGRWAQRNVERLWVGRSPEDLFEIQLRSNGKRLKRADIIHPKFTRELRHVARKPGYD